MQIQAYLMAGKEFERQSLERLNEKLLKYNLVADSFLSARRSSDSVDTERYIIIESSLNWCIGKVIAQDEGYYEQPENQRFTSISNIEKILAEVKEDFTDAELFIFGKLL